MEERNYHIMISSESIETFFEKRPKVKELINDVMSQEKTRVIFKEQVVDKYLELLNEKGIPVLDMNEFYTTLWEDFVMECKVYVMYQFIMSMINLTKEIDTIVIDLDEISVIMLQEYEMALEYYDESLEENVEEDFEDNDIPQA